MTDISIVVPGIRYNKWERLYSSIQPAIGKHSFELIIVSPHDNLGVLSDAKNVKLIKDWGCPSRALQIGSLLAEGEKLLWFCDDGYFEPKTLDTAIENCKNKNIINLLYTEGDEYKEDKDPRLISKSWFKARTHKDLRLKHIEDWWIAPLFIIDTNYWYKMGGIDCQFETLNFNLHDLIFRCQKDGANLQFSEKPFTHLDWQPAHTRNNCPVFNALFANDFPRLNNLYGDTLEAEQYKDVKYINIDNWKDSPAVWPRKWLQ